MSLSIFNKLAGTLLSHFRIGLTGPTLREGVLNPGDAEVAGNDGDIYIRRGANSGIFQLRSGFWYELGIVNYKRTPVTSPTFIATMQQHYLGVNRAGPVDISLPPGVNEKSFVIKDEGGYASETNTITIVPESGQSIDGQPNLSITVPYGSITLVYGDGWHVI